MFIRGLLIEMNMSERYRAMKSNQKNKFRNSRHATRGNSRRGVLLLVILGMLTLFLMIGTAFIVSSNQFRQANKSYSKVGEQKNLEASQKGFLGEVINQIIRDTNNQNSALRFHSLLRDMYGTEGIIATVQNNSAGFAGVMPNFLPAPYTPPGNVTNGQLIEFRFFTTTTFPYYNLAGVPHIQTGNTAPQNGFVKPLPIQNGALNGCTLTFISGPANGKSTRVVGYFNLPASNAVGLRVINVLGSDGTALTDPAVLSNSRFLINGRPYNGTGVGYDSSVTAANMPKLSAKENVDGQQYEISLMPNAAMFVPVPDTNVPGLYFNPNWATLSATQRLTAMNHVGYDGLGGSDESYDAADFQNMFLAWTSPAAGEQPNPPTSLGNLVLPSYHRPDLINYWRARLSSSTTPLASNPQVLRKILLRPNWFDHPRFTGSNPDFEATAGDPVASLNHMIFGPWDVDNDMDGQRDSVWLDFGAPVMVGAKGKLVKPLAAIMILDMDSRLNVNAHGTRELAGLNGEPNEVNFAQNVESDDTPRGQAFGVADIDLRQLLQGDIERLFRGEDNDLNGDGNDDEFIPGRYGYGNIGGYPDLVDDEPGAKDRFDLSAQLKMQGYPSTFPIMRSNFGTIPDLRSRYAMGLNDFGQSITDFPRNEIDRLTEDNPYELNISATGHRGTSGILKLSTTPPILPRTPDNPFSPAELERTLRMYDLDAATLPDRLYRLANVQSNPERRALLTTDSYDVPDVSFQVPAWAHTPFATVMGRAPVNTNYTDFIEFRLRQGQGMPLLLTAAQQNTLRQQLAMLVAPEMLAGMRLDLNRPIGNGFDDNGNGVVDEPGEEETPNWHFDDARLSPNEAGNAAIEEFRARGGAIHDNYDRDGSGIIEDTPANPERTLNKPTDLLGRINLHNYRRQLQARYLYVLAQAVVDDFDRTTTEGKVKSRQLAQWAINTVDFRDPDNIMTAFEYDENPFDGWNVDGDVSTTTGDTNATQRDIVWGMEKQELLMTEAIAWHDRRTTDTAREEIDNDRDPAPATQRTNPGTLEDSDPQKKDPDLDQQYRPKGAAFIELYNPNAGSVGASADTHAIAGINIPQGSYPVGADLGVNLSAVAVDPDDATKKSPVWRIQVYRNRKKQTPTKYYVQDIKDMLLFFDPEDQKSLPTANRPDVDRTIYFTADGVPAQRFTNNQPISGTDLANFDPADGVEFFTEFDVRPVRPGRYMVIGGGDPIDSGNPNETLYRAPVGLAKDGTIQRRIELRANMPLTSPGMNPTDPAPIRMFNADSAGEDPMKTPVYDNEFGQQEFMSDVAIINRVIDYTPAGGYVGPKDRNFNLSEPYSGYPERLQGMGSLWSTADMPAAGPQLEGRYVAGPGSTQPLPIDIPLDENKRAVRIIDPDLKHYGTVQGYRWVYLQRLANPLLPYNAVTNPYMTIDQTPVNLSVFNGLINSAIVKNSVNPEANFGASPPLTGELASMERGWKNDPLDLTKPHFPVQKDTRAFINPFQMENLGKRPRDNTVFKAGSDHFFNAMPDCTLGYLNRPFNNNFQSEYTDPAPGKPRINMPDQPFPWLTWNNRPFANPGELMQVPAVRSSHLVRSFSMISNSPTNTDDNLAREVYDGPLNDMPQKNGNAYYNLFAKQLPTKDGPFGHLPNFFRTQASTTGEGISGMHRVLDLVTVSSLFVGTETWLNPTTFSDMTTEVVAVTDPRYGLQPPFNKIASRREPGRININTIARKDNSSSKGGKIVWDSIWQGNTKRDGSGDQRAHNGPDDDDFFLTRRGYPGVDDNTLLDNRIPTIFANPFRTSGTASLVPIIDMMKTDLDSTLFRSFGGTMGANPTSSGEPFVSTAAILPNQAYRNSHRNPYFRYTPASRLSAMTTNRSNVYAIWVTVGFFEVEEVPPWTGSSAQVDQFGTPEVYNRVYPDGYTFGKEAGIDTGEVERVREFAFVDRTVPVAFEPGANHNTQDIVRLRRRIQE